MADRPLNKAARLSTLPRHEHNGTGERTPSMGFDLEDDAWMGLVRESIAPPALGEFAGYRLLAEVGRGAQGAVFRAVQPGTGREVALKHIAAGPLAGAVAKERFEREVSVLSSLRHPAIVSVYGVIETAPPHQHSALVMEYVDGVPMDEWAAGKSLHDRAEAVGAVCSAIAYAHQRGIIHRDIKPSNVLVVRDGQPRVLDFGLAALTGARRGVSGSRPKQASVVGTPAYAAPEQISPGTGAVDTRSDVYALGCLLYVVLTGQLPHGSDGSRRTTQAPSPRAVSPGIPADLCTIVTTAMAPEPERRYQSADAMLADIRRWQRGEAVLAHPPTLAYRLTKLVRRRPVASAIAAACVLAVVASAVVSTILAVRLAARGEALAAAVQQSREHAEEARRSAARSQTLAQTLRDTLSSVSESVAASAPGSVFHVTQNAVATIEQIDSDADPALAESLWYDVARVASKLGDSTVSEQAVSCGMPLAERVYGLHSAPYGRWLMVEGLCRERRHDNRGAEDRYRRAYTTLRDTQGEVSEEAAWAANNWGIMLFLLKDYDGSERMLSEALFVRIALHGERDAKPAETLRNLGSMERARKRFDAARHYYELALAAIPPGTDKNDPLVLGVVHNQLRLLRDEGRLDEALEQTTAAIDRLSTVADARSPLLGNFFSLRAQLYQRQKRYDEALADSLRRDDCVLIAPLDYPERIDRVLFTARAMKDAGRPAEALARLEAAYKELQDGGKEATDAGRRVRAEIRKSQPKKEP